MVRGKLKQIHDVIVKSKSRIGHSTPHIHENEDIREAFGGRRNKTGENEEERK